MTAPIAVTEVPNMVEVLRSLSPDLMIRLLAGELPDEIPEAWGQAAAILARIDGGDA